ncbi:hypothetical protein Sjap_011477 [Stephania japonica]|uniref:Uncharacterized protein n=1 Tax=Stephania japonica TaxID=461633 RepID=A0AAP0P7F6_9MAGN
MAGRAVLLVTIVILLIGELVPTIVTSEKSVKVIKVGKDGNVDAIPILSSRYVGSYENFNVKLSDFVLAKLGPSGDQACVDEGDGNLWLLCT